MAAFVFSDNCKKAYVHIFNLNYDEAYYLINVEKLYNPTNPSILFLNSGISFMKSILEEDPQAIELYFEQHDLLIAELNKTKENEEIKIWLLAETSFHSALVNFKTGSYLQGAWQLRKSYKTAYGALSNNNLLALKITGLTETFLSTVPDDYQWVLKIFGMNGDLQAGTKKLYDLFNFSNENEALNFIQPEIIFYIAYIEGNLLNNLTKALVFIDQNKHSPTGPLGEYIQVSLLTKDGNNKKAQEILSNELSSVTKNNSPFPYLYYMMGIIKLRNLDYSAENYFTIYINIYKGNHFLKAAHQKLAWIALLNNDINTYNQKLNDVLNKGTAETDEDKQALKQVAKKQTPGIELLKARLLFDGGNYKEAQDILSMIDLNILNNEKMVEYYYRSGRIKQVQNQYSSAEINFLSSIQLQSGNEYYFAPNAALQIALISEQQKDFKKAKEFFQKANSYKNYEYKNSIQQKAKAGLRRIHKN